MKPTPFFPSFKRLLFGRPPASLRRLVGPQCPDVPLAHYEQAYGQLVPAKALQRTGAGTNSRSRLFSPAVSFWGFLAQVLERGSSCRDALRRVSSWWVARNPERTPPSACTSAYCQARGRLSDEALQQINNHLAEHLEKEVCDDQRWKNREVKIIDGTTVSMPDTPANQQAWPQPKSQKPGCGFPLLKLVGIFSLASGAMLRVAHGAWRTHEAVLARTLWRLLAPGEILLADRGFCSFFDICQLRQRGIDVVLRLHQARPADFRRGRRLGKGDRLVVWNKPAQRTRAQSPEEFAALPESLGLRMIRYRIAEPGFRSREVVLVTSLLDARLYPCEELADLYFRRWGVELHFRQIKMLLGLDVLRCLTPKMIRKELLMHQIAYNLVRALMQRAAATAGVALGRLSFKGSLDSLHHFADAIHAASKSRRRQVHILDALLQTIAADPVPLRAGRTEPRARKRRPKNYHLLTQPRRLMCVPPHRNRPKSSSPQFA